MKRINLFFATYIIVVIALFIYSFTQVDLSLTLSQSSVYQSIQKNLQYIGFFQRPTSALIFAVIAGLFFIFYLSFLYLAKKQKISAKTIAVLVFLSFVFLVFSYNAFSYDLFNYIFDAKILVYYGQNPYLHKPTDFVDPMLNFMRWTHRLYPYGPSWLILTAPLSFIGLNIFLPTFFLFKILIGLSFVGSSYLIYKISKVLFPENAIFNTVFFAFNPLVIIEGLVSSHNDFPLIFFALLAIYLYLIKKKIFSLVSLIFSIGVKYASITLIPVFIYLVFMEKTKRKIDWEKLILFSFILSIGAIVFASMRTTFQPWYLMLPFALGSLISYKKYIFIPIIISSITCLVIYLTYVFMTDYAKGYPKIIWDIELVGFSLAIILMLGFILKSKLFSKD